MSAQFGCCKDVTIDRSEQNIELHGHNYRVTIVYCKNCGDIKATSNINHIRNKK